MTHKTDLQVSGVLAVALLSLTHCSPQETPDVPTKQASVQVPLALAELPTTSVSFQALADTSVSEDQPAQNFGAEPTLVASLSPARELYLRFAPDSIHGRVTRAVLRLFVTGGTQTGAKVFLAGSHWEELLVSWNTRPERLGMALDEKGASLPGTWVELDVTSAVYGGGEYNFVLVGTSPGGANFHSRESAQAQVRPQLVLTLEDTVGCMPLFSCTYYGAGGGLTGWVQPEGGPGNERLRALATDAMGGYVTAGLREGGRLPTGRGFWLTRYDREGTPLWRRQVTLGLATVTDLALTAEGHILAVGSYAGTPDLGTGRLPSSPFTVESADSGLFIARFSAGGRPLWAHGFPARVIQGGQRVAQPIKPWEVATDSHGNLLVTGGFSGEVNLGGGTLSAGLPSLGSFPHGRRVAGGFLAKFSATGGHLWSKVFPADAPPVSTEGRSVSTDGSDNVLVGVSAYFPGSLPEGPVGVARPFIQKYSAAGLPLWKREFSGAHGELVSVRPLGQDAVAFIANFVLPLTFGGRTYDTGHIWETYEGDDPSIHLGTLSATGQDGWLRRLSGSFGEDGRMFGLVTGDDGTITVSGHGEYMNLGGGLLRPRTDEGVQEWAPMVARYSRTGIHLWSRSFDVDFQGGEGWLNSPRLYLEPLPGRAVLAGSDFSLPLLLEGKTYTAQGPSDLVFLQLRP